MPNVATAVWNHAAATPDSVALRGPAGAWSYAVLRDRAAVVAGALRDQGVEAGDRVLLVAPSVPEFAGAYLGILALGASAVTANTMSTEPELGYVGRDAGVSLVLGWSDIEPWPPAAATSLGVPYWPLRPELDGATTSAPLDDPVDRAEDHTAAILYTSGTTGRPKGAQLTHGNFVASAPIFGEALGLFPEARMGTALPLFHVFGQGPVMVTTLWAGASLSLLPRFDAGELLALLGRERLTHMAGVPTMWNALLQAAGDAEPADFANLRLAASGGASLPGEVLRAFEDRFGCTVLEGYGLTETTGAATFHRKGRPAKIGSVGAALPSCEVAVRDTSGDEVAPGEVGEIYIRGPVIMKGYWNRPDATAEVLVDGWLRTGDLGSKDDDGDIRIVDRLKDLVVRGGYNVYPSEVEEVLYEHPDIVEAAVIGVPDDHYGEEVAAVVALRPGAQLTLDALRAWAKERLSAYKVPHLLAVIDELPKGATGKILKRAIDPALVRPEVGAMAQG